MTNDTAQLFRSAVQLHQAGRLAEAEQLYRQVLGREPNHADALHLLGVVAHQAGQHEFAVRSIQQAITLSPKAAPYFGNLGNALKSQGMLSDAVKAYQHSIYLRPNHAPSYSNLGNAYAAQGNHAKAIGAYQKAIEIQSDYAEAYYNLGKSLEDSDRNDEAVECYRKAVNLQPRFFQAHSNLGGILAKMGQLDESSINCQQAIALEPRHAPAYNNLAFVLLKQGRTDEAIAACEKAIALQPILERVHNNLGNALMRKGLEAQAISTFRHATHIFPTDARAFASLGDALKEVCQFDDSINACRKAIELDPMLAEAHYYIGNTLKHQGKQEEAAAAYRRALELRPDFIEAHESLAYTLHYCPTISPQTIFDEQVRWSEQHAKPLEKLIQPHANKLKLGRALRIGYVSPDFRQHPVSHFFLPIISRHDREAFEVYCYSDVVKPDTITDQIQSLACHWRNLVGLTDAQAADLIRQDEIDILIDLAGHTANNRLLVFARKPAPIQVTYLGYPGSTGLTAIDYRLTDLLADPPDLTENLHSEKLFRLPVCAWCYQPGDTPDPMPRPTGPVTFGCFNNFTKVTTPFLEIWAQILDAVPNSRLLLKGLPLSEDSSRQRLYDQFEVLGVSRERLELLGICDSQKDHLALYNRIDIALDPFPYHGTTTTCEALWMGVPVVTLAGKSHAARVGVSLLTHAGRSECVARDISEYVEIATSLASDPNRLAADRRALREQLSLSPLMNGARFIRDLEAAYQAMWTIWNSGKAR